MANNVGTKIGATMHWDPDGNNILGGIPDNQIGSFDYGWHGGQQRPLEHEATLLPMIEMGARQYSPALGRFLEVDPIEGGTANDYAYVSDPVNLSDLDGNGCGFLWLRKCAKKDRYDRLTNSQLVALYRSMGHYLPAGYKFRGQIRKDFIKALRVPRSHCCCEGWCESAFRVQRGHSRCRKRHVGVLQTWHCQGEPNCRRSK